MPCRPPDVIADPVEPKKRLHFSNRRLHLELICRSFFEQLRSMRFPVLGELFRSALPSARLLRRRVMIQPVDEFEFMQDELTGDQEIGVP